MSAPATAPAKPAQSAVALKVREKRRRRRKAAAARETRAELLGANDVDMGDDACAPAEAGDAADAPDVDVGEEPTPAAENPPDSGTAAGKRRQKRRKAKAGSTGDDVDMAVATRTEEGAASAGGEWTRVARAAKKLPEVEMSGTGQPLPETVMFGGKSRAKSTKRTAAHAGKATAVRAGDAMEVDRGAGAKPSFKPAKASAFMNVSPLC
ncbi:MAG: hypothetical protein BJ554DRAFT_291 [Olpidium bornovanus]|uniref:Uncharacterized protein n=1 Tax=Olpidium bornovanus TaxID=278681 RepID=A0A8H7ZUK3_9FUNG|nr:MAG: hypothetical protein BJ554DRAFT_291 [Olpidium bornovanus]